jgi:phosphohistidine phosphatase
VIFARNLDVPYKNLSLEPLLYHIGTKDLLSWLRKRPENQDVIMVFAHNPGITDFVNKCIDHHIDNVPTTGVAQLVFDVDLWSQIDKKADLLAFDYPKNQKKKL